MYERVINLPEGPREVGAQGKAGKEKASPHHPLHPNLPLCKD